MYNSSGISYYEDYIKKQRKKAVGSGGYMVDREAYVNFLETQLEKVSAATLAVQSFEGKLEQMQTQLGSMDEKISGNAKVAQLTQKVLEKVQLHQEAYEEYISKEIDARISKLQRELEDRFYVRRQEDTSEMFTANQFSKAKQEFDVKLKKQNQLIEDVMFKLNGHTNNPKLHPSAGSPTSDHYPERGMSSSRREVLTTESVVHKLVNNHEIKISQIESEMFNIKSDIERDLKEFMEKQRAQASAFEAEERARFATKNSLERIESTLNAKVSSLEHVIFKMSDEFDSIKEMKSANFTYYTTSLEEKLANSMQNTVNIVRTIERNVEKDMQDIRQDVQDELEQLQMLREEMLKQNQTFSAQSNASQDLSPIVNNLQQQQNHALSTLEKEVHTKLQEFKGYMDQVVTELRNHQVLLQQEQQHQPLQLDKEHLSNAILETLNTLAKKAKSKKKSSKHKKLEEITESPPSVISSAPHNSSSSTSTSSRPLKTLSNTSASSSPYLHSSSNSSGQQLPPTTSTRRISSLSSTEQDSTAVASPPLSSNSKTSSSSVSSTMQHQERLKKELKHLYKQIAKLEIQCLEQEAEVASNNSL